MEPAAERGVEVDQVHPLGAVVLPGQRRLQRVAVAGLRAGRALHQAHGLAVGDVDGGQQGEGHEVSPKYGSAAAEHDDHQGRQDQDDEHDEDEPQRDLGNQEPDGRAATTGTTTMPARCARAAPGERLPGARRGCGGPRAGAGRGAAAGGRLAGPAPPLPPPGASARPPAARASSGGPARGALLSQAGDPVAQQRDAGVAGLLRVELRRRQRPELDRRHERPVVGRR